MRITKKISFAAILAALSFILMLIGCTVETVTFSVAAIASLCTVVAIIELGYGYAFMLYLAVSVLSFLLLPIKDPLIYFAGFFGYYPIVKALSEKLGKALSYVIKGLVFSAAFFGILYFCLKIIAPGVTLTPIIIIGAYLVLIAVFYVFDVALTKLINSYNLKLRARLGIDKLLK